MDKLGNGNNKLIELRFINSFKFMATSLDSLTRNLVGVCLPGAGGKGEKQFGFENHSELQYELLTRKGVYPYEYMSSWDQFEDTELPLISFYSSLHMSKINESNYKHAQ